MQFLRAVSHSVMPAQPLQIQDDSSDDNTADNAETEIDNATTSNAGSAESAVSDPDNCCEVCLLQPRGVALVPCGHARFCANCADTVAASDCSGRVMPTKLAVAPSFSPGSYCRIFYASLLRVCVRPAE